MSVGSKLSRDQRESIQMARLKALAGSDNKIETLADLAKLPVLRKEKLVELQQSSPPLGPLQQANFSHLYQSPGPIYEPGFKVPDPWRFGRFLKAIEIGSNDIAQNTFAYHFTPAGAMFDTSAQAVGAVVFPAGPGQSNKQAEIAAKIKTTVYCGTPDFLQVILEKGDEMGLDLSSIKHAAVSAGPLFPQLRQAYADRGIRCRQCYGTADVGLIAYETVDITENMVIDENVIVEIVSPGTSDPVAPGEIGEVLVTVLTDHHSLLRFSVGDLSAIVDPDAEQPCIVGWRGRADQAAKVRGMFIRPEQVSTLVNSHPAINRARVEISSEGLKDTIEVKLESTETDSVQFETLVRDCLNLSTDIKMLAVGDLPRDGVLVSDLRGTE
jgi:phenylacetate-CoA ligase